MTGTILGYDNSNNTGTISGENGQRYPFKKENWKESIDPKKELKVDFAVSEDNEAIDIYSIRDKAAENTNTLMGLVAVAITFFFGFIGTLISRIALGKQSFGEALVPTVIHFVITLLLFIPFVGWIIYLIGTGYYMYQNYLLTVQEK